MRAAEARKAKILSAKNAAEAAAAKAKKLASEIELAKLKSYLVSEDRCLVDFIAATLGHTAVS